ncbi:MAG: hypothetical protein II358_01870 [Tidjanibacter sp.]|nr:hypothetical protein [Tidjanibacter sp.]
MLMVNLCIALLLLAVGGVVVYGAMYSIIRGMKETIDRQHGKITELEKELEKEREEHYLTKDN